MFKLPLRLKPVWVHHSASLIPRRHSTGYEEWSIVGSSLSRIGSLLSEALSGHNTGDTALGRKTQRIYHREAQVHRSSQPQPSGWMVLTGSMKMIIQVMTVQMSLCLTTVRRRTCETHTHTHSDSNKETWMDQLVRHCHAYAPTLLPSAEQ